MKSIYVTILCIVAGIGYVSAQQGEKVKWYTVAEVQELNKKESRHILIDVYTDWCGWCKTMDDNTFNNPTIARYINSNFYPVKFNAESKEPATFAGHTFINEGTTPQSVHQLAVALLNGQMSYPSVAYLTGKLELIGPVPGYLTPAQIEPLLHYIVEEKYKENISLTDYQKNFASQL